MLTGALEFHQNGSFVHCEMYTQGGYISERLNVCLAISAISVCTNEMNCDRCCSHSLLSSVTPPNRPSSPRQTITSQSLLPLSRTTPPQSKSIPPSLYGTPFVRSSASSASFQDSNQTARLGAIFTNPLLAELCGSNFENVTGFFQSKECGRKPQKTCTAA